MPSLIEIIQSEDVPTEEVKICPLCNSSDYDFLFWNFDRLYHLPGKFGLIKCSNCDLVRLSPRPLEERLSDYYPNDAYYIYQTPTASINTINKRSSAVDKVRQRIRNLVFDSLGYPDYSISKVESFFQPYISLLFLKQATYGWGEVFPQYKNEGMALDIGCGNGSFLSYLKYLGWKVQGIEMSEKAAELARLNFGIDVFTGKLKDAPFEPDSFDYIHLSQVLEHLPDLEGSIKIIKNFLKKDGILFIGVPNFLSYNCQINQELWYGWETPRHLYMFSPSNLRHLLEENGLKIIKMKTVVGNLFDWDITYYHENRLGRKLDKRPYVSKFDFHRITYRRLMSKIQCLVKPDSGDYIWCWVTK
jgi:SAM-dependent methyltransferase